MKIKQAMITGASSGIGQACAKLLAIKKIDLILTARNEQALLSLKELLSKKVSVKICVVDLVEEKQRETLINLMIKESPDLLINSAGIGKYGDILCYPIDKQMSIIDTNIVASTALTISMARQLISKKKKGIILNISSAGGFQVYPGFSIYCASKAYMNNFSQAFDHEISPLGVRVLCACPGMVKTNFGNRASSGMLSRSSLSNQMSAEEAAKNIWFQIILTLCVF